MSCRVKELEICRMYRRFDDLSLLASSICKSEEALDFFLFSIALLSKFNLLDSISNSTSPSKGGSTSTGSKADGSSIG